MKTQEKKSRVALERRTEALEYTSLELERNKSFPNTSKLESGFSRHMSGILGRIAIHDGIPESLSTKRAGPYMTLTPSAMLLSIDRSYLPMPTHI